jgi:hypothetical protein
MAFGSLKTVFYHAKTRLKKFLKKIGKQNNANKGAYIKNGNLVGHGGTGIKPVNESWTQGVQNEPVKPMPAPVPKPQLAEDLTPQARILQTAQDTAAYTSTKTQAARQSVKPR